MGAIKTDTAAGYKGVDFFRIAAAVLVIAIHTSPLETVSGTADFILTRVTARVAVPFFFMASGFFLLSDGCAKTDRLKKFLKKTALIYIVSIVLYLPLNIYSGYFLSEELFLKILKDLFFDGTFYHLWYLPASALGAALVFFTVRGAGYRAAFFIFLLLYFIGLFGDSYYGISENIAPLKAFYGGVFAVSDHTRNGIFFAPLFMLMGGIEREREKRRDKKRKAARGAETAVCGGGFELAVTCVFFALMLTEALILRKLGLQRHDSMYIFLVPLMRFLFGFIVRFRGKRRAFIGNLALLVYIIHPVNIVAVRAEGKALGLESLFIDNGMVHFALVCLCSFAEGAGILLLSEFIRRPKGKHIKRRK